MPLLDHSYAFHIEMLSFVSGEPQSGVDVMNLIVYQIDAATWRKASLFVAMHFNVSWMNCGPFDVVHIEKFDWLDSSRLYMGNWISVWWTWEEHIRVHG